MKAQKSLWVKSLLRLFFVGLFIYFLTKIDLGTLREFSNSIGVITWIALFLSFFALYLVKTMRFKVLNKKISFSRLFCITIIHNFWLNLLPFKLGEIAYIRELQKEAIRIKKSLMDIIIIRIFDIASIAIIVIVFVLSGLFKDIGTMGVIVLLILIGLILLVMFHRETAIFISKKIEQILNYFGWNRTTKHIRELRKIFLNISISQKIKIIVTSVLIWVVSLVPWLILIQAAFDISYSQALMSIVFIFVITNLPINTPGGAGVIESAWVIALLSTGIGINQAINFSLLVHAVILIEIFLFYGIVKFWQFISACKEKYSKKNKSLQNCGL